MPDYAPVDLSGDDLVEFELNGTRVSAPAGTMLADACAAHQTTVPVFCYEPRLGAPLGACRMCLVRVEGMRGLVTACSTPVAQDMVVDTVGDEVKQAQDGVLELLLANHPLDCPVCDKGGECPLQDHTFEFGPGTSRMLEPKRHFEKPVELSNRVALDRERCISCYRCVRFSQDVAEDGQLTMQERGDHAEIATFSGEDYEGRFTGNVIDICPVGALTSIPYRFVSRPWDVANTPSVCTACPVGCNSELTLREGQVMRVTGREQPNWDVEEGWLCDKGRWAYAADRSPERLTAPLVRDGGETREVSLEQAVAAAGVLLGRGPSRQVLLGGDVTVEEAFLAQQLAEQALGGAAVGAAGPAGGGLNDLRAQTGAQLGDIDNADLIVVVGGDPANQHPVAELRLRKARRGGAALIAIGPRPHAVEALADVRRSAPGALAEAVAACAERVAGATRPIIVWDERDLDAEPAAAAAVTEMIASHAAAAQLELSAEVNGAGLRALGIGPDFDLLAEDLGAVLAVRADPLAGPGARQWASALDGAETIIAVASHRSELTDRARVVIPCSSHFEHDGVVIGSAARAQRIRPGATLPEGAAPGWEIVVALAHQLGLPVETRSASTAFAAAAGRHSALADLDYDALGNNGVALSVPGADRPARDVADSGAGLVLVTRRAIYGDRVTQLSDALDGVRSPATLGLHSTDAESAGLSAGDTALVESDHGSCRLTVRIDDALAAGVALADTGTPGANAEALYPPDRAPITVRVGRG